MSVFGGFGFRSFPLAVLFFEKAFFFTDRFTAAASQTVGERRTFPVQIAAVIRTVFDVAMRSVFSSFDMADSVASRT